MKKFLLIIVAALVIFSFSCTDQENVSKADNQAVLIENLQQFNESLITSEKESRSFMRFLCVASADVAGAYEVGRICGRFGLFVGGIKGALIGGGIGGLIGGVGASYGAYCGTRSQIVSHDSKELITSAYAVVKMNDELVREYPRENIDINLPKKHKDLLEIGIKHNIILDMVRNEREILEEIIPDSVLTEEEKNVLESKEFIDSYNNFIPKYATLSVDEFLSGETVDSKVMSLFLDIYNAYPENIQDVKFIINKYIELIEASDSFTDDEKQSIYAGLSVAVCSYEYWENNNNLYLK